MTPILPTNISSDPHCLTWLFTNSAGARVSTRILFATSTQKHFAAPQTVPAARPNLDPDAFVLARSKALPTSRVTYTPEPAAKSP
jgi:hypothetical protein